MKIQEFKKMTAAFVCVTVLFSFSGCATLKPSELEQYGYHGTAVVKQGKRVLPVDILGNIFGVFEKLVLWNWKIKRHNITPETQQAVEAYLKTHGDEVGDVLVDFNRYAPQDAFRRLFHNKGVKWPYRYTFGILMVLIVDTILIDRIFGGDRYNPYTHTVHIHSDIPSVALHELGHAKDFAARRYRGSYALLRILPFTDLYQEYIATDNAFKYVREEKLQTTEVEAYKTLYPAYGTYAGSYLFIGAGVIIGAVIGHIVGRTKAHNLEIKMHGAAV